MCTSLCNSPRCSNTVIGNIFVLVPLNRPAAEHRIAMFTMPGGGIGTVYRFVAYGRQIVGLGLRGPMVKIGCFAPMQLAHLLQAHDVGIHLLHRQPQVMDLQTSTWPDTLHALVGCCTWLCAENSWRELHQALYRLRIRAGEAQGSSFVTGQPLIRRMFPWTDGHRCALRHLQTKHTRSVLWVTPGA